MLRSRWGACHWSGRALPPRDPRRSPASVQQVYRKLHHPRKVLEDNGFLEIVTPDPVLDLWQACLIP